MVKVTAPVVLVLRQVALPVVVIRVVRELVLVVEAVPEAVAYKGAVTRVLEIVLGAVVLDETLSPNVYTGLALLASGLAILDGRILKRLRGRS